jgi:macrolide transport system ATP-binding/permease protein
VSEPVIELDGITRVYSVGDVEVHALNGVSLRVERGEFIAIMGASGSGKSTLMNIIGCLDRPTGGEYRFDGVDVATLSEAELARNRGERIGFVFQNFNLLARTSALDNVALPLFYASSGPPSRTGRLLQASRELRLLGLGDRQKNTPNQLSGGQQQRVAIARALINAPAVVLADEPTGNLDTKTSHEIIETLRSLNRTQGVTMVVVTHEPDIAGYADRIVTMRDGKIVSDERNPATRTGGPVPAVPVVPYAGGGAASTLGFVTMIAFAAAQAIGRNKMRSALTMLGVFIGVAALIAMVAVGQGADQAVRAEIESLGTNLLVVIPGATTAAGVRAGFGSAQTLTAQDAQAIQRDDPAVGLVSYDVRQLAQVVNGNQNWTTSVQGVTPSYLVTNNWEVQSGRPLTAADEDSAAMVCLVGQTVYRQLFQSFANPIGSTILVKGAPMRVIGVLASKGQSGFGQDQDDVIMIPFTTAVQKVLGVAGPTSSESTLATTYPPPPNPYGLTPRLTGFVQAIFVQAASAQLVPEAIQQVTVTLQRRHHIQPAQPNDFAVRNLSQIAQTAASSSQIMATLLAAVASISLLVGGIGIMNILLVSVTERTREIGLRMAVGARRLQVLLQFLAEAVLLSATGGVVGIVAGIVISQLVSAIAHWPIELSAMAIAVGFLFSAAVGIFFGYYPARKAARLDPIEALRYE